MADPAVVSTGPVGISFESTRGTASAGTYTTIPYTSCVIEPVFQQTRAEIYDSTRQKDALVGSQYSVSVRISGPVNYEDGFQDLVKAVFGASWSAGSISAAGARNFFTLQQKMDLASDRYILAKGLEVDTFGIEMPLNGAATYSATLLGLSVAESGSVTGTFAGTLAGDPPFSSGLTGAGITWDAGALEGVETASLNFTNQLNAKFAWGSTSADHITAKNFNVTGSLQQYWRAATLLTAALAGTPKALVFTLVSDTATAGEDTMTITLPAAKPSGAPIGESDTTKTQGLAFEGQFSVSTKCTIAVA